MKKSILILMYCLTFCFACTNNIERNTIVFKDKFANAQDSLVKFEGLLNKMQKNKI